MTQTKIDFGPQLELEFSEVPPSEMNGKKQISMIEVAKALKKTRSFVTKKLVEKGIFYYFEGRYLPKTKFVKESYFRIDLIESGYIGKVPKLIVLVKGFHLIKGIITNGK